MEYSFLVGSNILVDFAKTRKFLCGLVEIIALGKEFLVVDFHTLFVANVKFNTSGAVDEKTKLEMVIEQHRLSEANENFPPVLFDLDEVSLALLRVRMEILGFLAQTLLSCQ